MATINPFIYYYMTLRNIILSALISLPVTAFGNFGSDPKPDESLSLEERGLPGNLAFLIHYADAVVVAKKDRMMTSGNGLLVMEVLWTRKAMQLPKEIYVVTDSLYYTNNSRIVVPTDIRLSEGEFTYGTMANYDFVPTLLFLRKGEIDEKWRTAWDLDNRPLFKAVNGKQGVIPLPHLAAEADKNRADRFWDTVGQRAVKEASALVGSTDSSLIISTLRLYYADKNSEFEALKNPVTEKLETDAVKLLRSMASE